jgi:MFS family permease
MAQTNEPGRPDPAPSGVRVTDVSGDIGVEAARSRFGGVDIPATLAGALAALGTAVLLAGIGAAAGSFGYQMGLDDAPEDLTIAGLIAGLATLILAFLVGGWVAGRVARYDGGRNGLVTALWFVLLAAAASALGAWAGEEYDVFRNVNLPQWFNTDALTGEAIATGLLALLVMFGAAWIGGRLGERYHRRADSLVARTRPGGVGSPRRVVRAS